MESLKLEELKFDSAANLGALQALLSLPRETLPQLTLAETRKALVWAGGRLGLELIENESNIPSFLLLTRGPEPPQVTLFASWHAEALPVAPAAVEGAERLALVSILGAIGAIVGLSPLRVAVVVVPAASQGSRGLEENLARHRDRLSAPCAFWIRVAPRMTARRRIFLGARGRVVLGVWGADANPYRVRDELVLRLAEEAYGPRPLDFELLRKLSQDRGALDFLEEVLGEEPKTPGADPTDLLRAALFEPRGQVLTPQVRHPDRPNAWIVIETAENMEPGEIHARAQSLAGTAKVEMAEGFPWDRLNIHHPSIQSELGVARSRSQGAEFWPMAPWASPSGLFTRALGTPLAEWGIPFPAGTAVRFPSASALETMEREIAELILRAAGAFAASHVP